MTMSTLDRLRQSVADHPRWNWSDHAQALGISRQRVSQLRKEHGLTHQRGERSDGILMRMALTSGPHIHDYGTYRAVILDDLARPSCFTGQCVRMSWREFFLMFKSVREGAR